MKEREEEKKGGKEQKETAFIGIPQKITEIHILVFKIPK